ncbi:MAG: radical SAM protein [Planctomycetaceae bacterium]|jgi:MoaA/NifB/PqqE/SkfB family radical SAM enzyme|nr:radical SAM protein [Planctomycetaceae bacterium]
MLPKFLYRTLTSVSWILLEKAAYNWCFKGFFAIRAFKQREKNGIQFPPFLFFSLTNRCNLRCRGCWVSPSTAELPTETIENIIKTGQKHSVYFYTLLGGEPFLAPAMFGVIERHPEAYFQIITNGQFLDSENAAKIKKFGNVSPLVSIDGPEPQNDARRGAGTFAKAVEGCKELQRQKILYGVATVVTAQNLETVLTEEFVQKFITLGTSYLWFYFFRPAGSQPEVSDLALNAEQLLEMRRRLLTLRRKMPLIIIDTYWDANGNAVCPASRGMAYVIASDGGINPCPPLTVAKEFVSDNGGDFYKTMNESGFLRRFRAFVHNQYSETSQGCVIIDRPGELAEFFRQEGITAAGVSPPPQDVSPRTSHYLPGEEIPENYWVYKILKKMLFFGMGAYG